MVILGDDYFCDENMFKIENEEDIKNTPPNSCVYLESFSKSLCLHLKENDIAYACFSSVVSDVLILEKLNAKYIICDDNIAKRCQEMADNYLFDAKIIMKAKSLKRIEYIAGLGLDGAWLTNGV